MLSISQGDFNSSVLKQQGRVFGPGDPRAGPGKSAPIVEGKHVKAFAAIDSTSPDLAQVMADNHVTHQRLLLL